MMRDERFHNAKDFGGGLSRRSMLAAAVPAFLLSPFSINGAGVEQEASSLVIGKFLARNAASGVVGNVAAGIVGPMIFGQSEEMGKLNEILDRLKTLQDSIDRFRTDVARNFSRQEYLTATTNAAEINKINRFLMGPYRKWVAGDRTARAEFFERLAENSVALNRGLQDWNDAVAGSDGPSDALSVPGMLKTWNRSTIDRHGGLLGPDTARDIQDHWDRIDLAQAVTVLFTVIDKAVKKNTDGIVYKLREWRDFRAAQVKMLRGMVRQSDSFYDVANPSQPVTTPLNFLPPGTAVTPKNSVMWSLEVTGPIPKCDTWQEFEQRLNGIRPAGAGWGLRRTEEMRDLFRACGGTADPDRFLAQMKKAGFRFHEENRPSDWRDGFVSVWSADSSHNREVTYQGKSGRKTEIRYRRDVVIEGDTPRGANSDWVG